MRGLYFHFVLTGGHIYLLGIYAKLVGHRTRHSQIFSGHNFDFVCYLPIDERTFVKLNDVRDKNKTNVRIYESDSKSL